MAFKRKIGKGAEVELIRFNSTQVGWTKRWFLALEEAHGSTSIVLMAPKGNNNTAATFFSPNSSRIWIHDVVFQCRINDPSWWRRWIVPNHTNNKISIETDGTQKQEQVIITSISTAGSLSDFDFRVLNFRVFQELPWRPHPGDSRFDSSKCFTVDVSCMFELCLFLCGDFVRFCFSSDRCQKRCLERKHGSQSFLVCSQIFVAVHWWFHWTRSKTSFSYMIGNARGRSRGSHE